METAGKEISDIDFIHPRSVDVGMGWLTMVKLEEVDLKEVADELEQSKKLV